MKQKKQGKNPLVGVLVDTSTGWGRRLVQGVLSYEREHGPWHVWIETRGSSEKLSLPGGWRGDGVIARVSDAAMAASLKKTGIPVVNVSGIRIPNTDFPRVTVDYDAAAELGYRHFRDRGFTNFGYVGPLGLAYVRRHQASFSRVLQAAGQTCHVFEPPRVRGTTKWEARMNALQDWLHALPKPVGVYVWAEDVGRQVVHACIWADLFVPHDVAILGSDHDEVLCDASHPPISGIVGPSEQLGRKAAEVLHQLMRGETNIDTPILIPPTEVVAKASTDTLAVDDRRLAQALSFVRDHACEKIQVEDILRQVPMARRSLERKFEKAIGRSPFEEIRRLRIARARTLLSQTDLPMQAIADSCGYSSYNYLTFAFKRETGMTPSAYRKQQRGS